MRIPHQTKYDNAAYKIRSRLHLFRPRRLRLLKGKLEINGTFDLQGPKNRRSMAFLPEGVLS